ncbi:hypothetical protein [Candidatus Clostridium radicumherbarum]|uniref:Uncharacterized protein n=1 Tax=Candidatus Clostridium radicumherbarum TaxID=3381662 RepID=A0ABW8TTA2_9CLOT
MRGDYDIVEDLELRESKLKVNNKFIKVLIIVLIFVVLYGLCFNLVYIFSYHKIENSNDMKLNTSNKIYIIEQKLRKDLDNMNLKNKN